MDQSPYALRPMITQPPLALADALIDDLASGALSIAIVLKIIDLLRDNGRQDAAAAIEARWDRGTLPAEALAHRTQIRRTPE